MEYTCTKCKITKDESLFYKDKSKPNNLHTNCKLCHSSRNKLKRKTNLAWREMQLQKSKEYRNKYPDKNRNSIRNATLKAKYGITSKEYDDLFALQGYKCAVCGCTKNNGYGKMPVDHCHTTGKVRAILCQSCNVTLGKVGEKEEILLALINYLRKHKGE
jgi:hypothetical protein